MTTPRVSIVISTRNRAAILPAALRAHERIVSALPWELIIVDNGSTDRTPEVLDAFGAATRLMFRTLVEPRPGLSCARNTGWRNAAAELVAFTDDDCYPSAVFVDAIVERFADRRLGYLGGRIVLHDPEDAPVTIQLRDTPHTIAPGSFIAAGLIQGANMAARREVLEAVDGFDELLGAGTPFPSEDVDFVSRASAAGYAGAYDPGPAVEHHHRRRAILELDALRGGYDLGRGAYYAKCLLDPRRRGKAWRPWLEHLLRSAAAAPGSRRARAQLAGELRGAIGYVHARAAQREPGRGRRT